MEGQSVIIYPQSEEELRDKLVNVTLELESMKNVKDELFDSLMLAYRERDEAIAELQKLMKKPMMPTATITNICGSIQHEHHAMFSVTKPNSTITESITPSHGSAHVAENTGTTTVSTFQTSNPTKTISPEWPKILWHPNLCSPTVDSMFDTVSSSEFSHITNNNISYSYLSQNLVSASDAAANAIIDSLSKVRALPEKGKLVEAVIDAGPLLQNVIFAGPIPTWRNPPPLENIKIPPLTIKVNDICSNTNTSTYLKPKVPSNAHLSTTSCSSSMLNFAGHQSSSFNAHCVELRKRQRHQ